jgi:tryptophan-rich sensory protein
MLKELVRVSCFRVRVRCPHRFSNGLWWCLLGGINDYGWVKKHHVNLPDFSFGRYASLLESLGGDCTARRHIDAVGTPQPFFLLMTPLDVAKLLGLVAFCELIGFASSLFMGGSIATWYVLLSKPSWTPPNWLFAPVWTTLYALMGVSLYLIFKSKSRIKSAALGLFGAQLFLNFLWSIVFFGQHLIFYSCFVIAGLWGALLLTILATRKVSKSASLVLLPYLVWVSVAACLNFSVLILNSPKPF